MVFRLMSRNLKESPMNHYPHQKDCLGLMLTVMLILVYVCSMGLPRIVACDICEIWHHSRCSGIEDAEAVPPLFVCLHKGRLFRKVVS